LPQRAARCGFMTAMLTDGVFECQSRLSTKFHKRPALCAFLARPQARKPVGTLLRKRIYDVISCLWTTLAHFGPYNWNGMKSGGLTTTLGWRHSVAINEDT
jgi:hypothetical protein